MADFEGSLEMVSFTHEVLPNFIPKEKIAYRVKAVNNVGEGPFSEALTVTTRNRFWSKAHSWDSRVSP